MSEWLDIETAPKNGDWILLYLPWCGEVRMGRFNANSRYHAGWRACLTTKQESVIYGLPSHWMALPAPPKLESVAA